MQQFIKMKGGQIKMGYSYRMQKNTVQDERKQMHTVYGIEAIDSAGKILSSFPDVFFDRQTAERFVDLCNDGKLSLIHLRDVVTDALAG